jgi:hypothetical protein
MIVSYLADFIGFERDFYNHFQYVGPLTITVELRNVASLALKLSNVTEWTPIPRQDGIISRDISVMERLQRLESLDVVTLRRILNTYFRQAGLPGREDDSLLPERVENEISKLARNTG